MSVRTRAGRLRLLDRIELSRHAADLLHSKEEALERERVRLQGHADRAEARWHDHCRRAAGWLTRARVLGASDELTDLVATTRGDAEVTPRWQTSMGISYPGDVGCAPGGRPAPTSTAALMPTTEAYRDALDAAATHAATAAAVRRLDDELAATRRRRRAIEDHLHPRLVASLHDLDLYLDELDRDEALRVHVATSTSGRHHISAGEERHRPC